MAFRADAVGIRDHNSQDGHGERTIMFSTIFCLSYQDKGYDNQP